MPVSGQQYKQLVQALISAFPTRHALAAMVRFQLNESLEEIASPGALQATAFELIRWAIAENRLEELVRGARAENPGNPELQLVAVEVRAATPPASADLSALVPLLRWADANGRLGQLIALACAPGAPEPDLRTFVSETLASATDRAAVMGPTASPPEPGAASREALAALPDDATGAVRPAWDRLHALAARYESIRSMPYSPQRTQLLEGVASEMRMLAPAAHAVVDRFAGGATAGERLVAVMLLQERPREERLAWLAERVREEKPFVGYHAALALRNAARALPAARDAVEAAVRDARAIEHDRYTREYRERDRMAMLESAMAAVAQGAPPRV